MERNNIDPEYLRLYRQYVSALRAYEIALGKWMEFREREGNTRRSSAPPRRPVGASPPTAATAPSDASEPSQDKRPMRVYLGEVLGWITLQPSSFAGPDHPYPEESFDWLNHYFRTRRRMFWNAEDHYKRCKQAFFDYARSGAPASARRRPTRDVQMNLDQAQQKLREGAALQLVGDDAAAEEALRAARLEVETVCYKTWDNYRNAPAPKSPESKIELLLALADAQLVGLDESAIVKILEREMASLLGTEPQASP